MKFICNVKEFTEALGKAAKAASLKSHHRERQHAVDDWNRRADNA